MKNAGREINLLQRVSAVGLRSPMLTELHAFWQQRRGGRAFPARADIDPLDMRRFLGRVMMFDVLHDPRRFRFRLVATDWVERFGLDPTGRFVDEYPRDGSPDFLNDVLGKTVDWGEPTTITRSAVLNGQIYEYEGLLLPLATDGATVDIIMTGFELP